MPGKEPCSYPPKSPAMTRLTVSNVFILSDETEAELRVGAAPPMRIEHLGGSNRTGRIKAEGSLRSAPYYDPVVLAGFCGASDDVSELFGECRRIQDPYFSAIHPKHG